MVISPRIRQLALALQQGQVIAYATEAVWGLGCLPADQSAVLRLLELKNRPLHKGLILVSGEISHFEFLLQHCTPEQRFLMNSTWPGPNTWLVPHHNLVPSWICGNHHTVAIRVSNHPTIKALSAAIAGPLVSSSANPQGLAPARTGYRARFYFGEQIRYAPGQIGRAAKPSQIRDLISGNILRPA